MMKPGADGPRGRWAARAGPRARAGGAFAAGVMALGVVAAGVMTVGGCADPARGYSFASTFDQSVRTVAVPVFENETFSPGLESLLTEAIIKRIQATTPWAVTSEERADTVLRGTLTRADLQALSVRRVGGVPDEIARRVTVSFTWRDQRTGELRLARDGFTASAAFVPSISVEGEPGERVEIGDRQAVQELAEAIVAEMRADW